MLSQHWNKCHRPPCFVNASHPHFTLIQVFTLPAHICPDRPPDFVIPNSSSQIKPKPLSTHQKFQLNFLYMDTYFFLSEHIFLNALLIDFWKVKLEVNIFMGK